MINLFHRSSPVHNCGVGEKGEYFSKYKYYLCFNITIRTNKLVHIKTYTSKQQKTFRLIKNLHNKGLGYRKISHYLNEKNILTERGNRWGSNYVYSVLKRYKERQNRIRNIINKKYEPEISNLWLEYK